jgi:allophanate hydrolase
MTDMTAGPPTRETSPAPGAEAAVPLLVLGAHMAGFPAHARISRHGAVPLGRVRTTAGYRLHDLGGDPPRPGLVHDPAVITSATGELWLLPRPAIADLLLETTPPLGFGWVDLDDGRRVLGYLCAAAATAGRPLVADGDWRLRRP